MFRARRHVAWGGIIRGSVDHPLHNSAYGLGPSITWTPAWKPKHSHNCHLRCRLWKCCKHSEARRNPRRRFAGSGIQVLDSFISAHHESSTIWHGARQKKTVFLLKQKSSHRATFSQLSSECLSSLENAVSVPSGAVVVGPQPRRPLKTSAHFKRLLSGHWQWTF